MLLCSYPTSVTNLASVANLLLLKTVAENSGPRSPGCIIVSGS
jgi:hypothetical protein